MNLFVKIYISLILGLSILLSVDGYLNFQREVDQFDLDMANTAVLLGKIMSGIVRHALDEDGEEKVKEVIKDANQNENQAKIKWVWIDPLFDNIEKPYIPIDKLDRVKNGQSDTFKLEGTSSKEHSYRYSYVPVKIGNNKLGAIEICQPLSSLKKYKYDALIRALIISGFSLLISGTIFFLLFQRLIRSPLSKISAKAYRIGEGDLTPDLVIKGKNEFSEFAKTMNEMCERLLSTQEAVKTEYNERIKTLEQLQHSERLTTIGKLSSGVAHEIGTPLNVVAGRAKLIKTGGLKQNEISECAEIIIEQVKRMTRLMQQVVNFARCDSHRKSLENIQTITQNVLNMLRQTARSNNVIFKLTCEPELPFIYVDSSQVQQVLINVIMNGIQAMPSGGNLIITLKNERLKNNPRNTTRIEEYMVISVQDEGTGIPEADLKYIFDPFFTTKKIGEGTGLGLSIVNGIIEEHEGWIEVNSTMYTGSRFTIYLPVKGSK